MPKQAAWQRAPWTMILRRRRSQVWGMTRRPLHLSGHLTPHPLQLSQVRPAARLHRYICCAIILMLQSQQDAGIAIEQDQEQSSFKLCLVTEIWPRWALTAAPHSHGDVKLSCTASGRGHGFIDSGRSVAASARHLQAVRSACLPAKGGTCFCKVIKQAATKKTLKYPQVFKGCRWTK